MIINYKIFNQIVFLCVQSNFPLEQPQSKFKFVVGHHYSVTTGSSEFGGIREFKDENGSSVSSRFCDFDTDGSFWVTYDDPLHRKLFEAFFTKDESLDDYKRRLTQKRFDL